MDDIDEFEAYKAMAFNRNRRGSQSVPSTPQIAPRNVFQFSRELSKSDRHRRSSSKRRNKLRQQQQQPQTRSSHISAQDMRDMCNSVSEEGDLSDRLSRLSMTEIWVRRLCMQRHDSSDHEDDHSSTCHNANMLYPVGNYGYTAAVCSIYPQAEDSIYHEPLHMRRSNPEHSSNLTTIDRMNKIDHRRSLSCRDRTKHLRNQHSACAIRPRTSSMPSKGNVKRPNTLSVNPAELSPRENVQEFYILRTFSTSKKGLINRGDSFKRRKTPSTTTAESDGMGAVSTASSVGSVQSNTSQPPVYRVLMIGANGVGKTSLVQQFTSSDYMANIRLDSNADNDASESEQKLVSVQLDDDESSLFFVTASNLQERRGEESSDTDAYVIVYSVSDRDSLDHAVDMLRALDSADGPLVATILVANKADMVRSRIIDEEEGKDIAVHFSCKYIEVSAIMNLRVDELLAGIVKQITLTSLSRRRRRVRNSKKRKRTGSHREKNGCIEYAARGLVGKIFNRPSLMFRSCDNLQVG